MKKVKKKTGHFQNQIKKKSNLHYTCSITSKRRTSGRAHFRGTAHDNTDPKKRRESGDTVSDLTNLGFKPKTFRADSNVLTAQLPVGYQHTFMPIKSKTQKDDLQISFDRSFFKVADH